MSIEDLWHGARTGPGKRWLVRWREGGVAHKRRFDSKGAAVEWDARRRIEPEVRLAIEGRSLTVESMMATWLASAGDLRPKTRDAYRGAAAKVCAEFGDRLASSLSMREIRTWVARDAGASVRRQSFLALRQAYRLAIEDGLLTANPCLGVRQPRLPESDRRALSWDELARLASVVDGDDAAMIWLLGTTGLRIGEMAGLQVGDVNVRRGRLRISRSVTYSAAGRVVGPPKSGRWRDVGVPRFVLEMLPVAGRRRDEWLFRGARGERLDAPGWRRRTFARAAEAAGLPGLHPHELRHTAASLAIADGANVTDVQTMLGHASPEITLRIYTHAWDSGVDRVAQNMDRRGHARGTSGGEKGTEGHAEGAG